MGAAEDRRLFERGGERGTVLVASGAGVVEVEVAGDRIGSFGLLDGRPANGVTVFDGDIAVATDTDVMIGDRESLAGTEFGPAATIGTGDGLLAAAPDGTVARWTGTRWRDLGMVSSVRAIERGFLAAADGIHRCEPDLPHVGLADANDVTAAPVPRAATESGIYRLGNGWLAERDGHATVVAGAADGPRIHAVIDDVLHQWVEDTWTATPTDEPGRIVDVAYGAGTYAITDDGMLLAEAGSGWRSQVLGVEPTRGIAVLSG